MSNKLFIHFLGAAETVTGSKYLVESGDTKILVDCGLFQGVSELRVLNWDYLPIQVSEIDFVLLTHGHLDHVGYLPRLINSGFKGRIYGTAPTLEIARIILKDSAKIQEEDAERANKKGYSKHKPAKALYTVKDVENTLTHFQEIQIDEWIDLEKKVEVRFQTNGHILGSTFIELHIAGKKLVFSGDIGQETDLLMYPPKRPLEADVVLIESTYGDRIHPSTGLQEQLKKIILQTIEKGGNVLIPSFAVERTQLLMYMIWKLRTAGEIPDIPCIMDSPMGANVLEVFHKFKKWHKLSEADCDAMCSVFEIVRDFQATQTILQTKYPKIVIAGSGMITGGRILSYLQEYIGKPETTLLFVGYQGEGTRGRKLLEGEKKIKLYGKEYSVEAKIEIIDGLSAHGDQEDLLNWLSDLKKKPQDIFIIHGEKEASKTLQKKIKELYNWDAEIPKLYEIKEIL